MAKTIEHTGNMATRSRRLDKRIPDGGYKHLCVRSISGWTKT